MKLCIMPAIIIRTSLLRCKFTTIKETTNPVFAEFAKKEKIRSGWFSESKLFFMINGKYDHLNMHAEAFLKR